MRGYFFVSMIFCHLVANQLHSQTYNQRFASVSPDGQWIVFESNQVKPSHIFIVRPNGKDLRQLTHEGINVNPAWSGSGMIAYSTMTERGLFDIYTMKLEEEKAERLVSHKSMNLATKSLDGWLYYTSTRNDTDQLRRINLAQKNDELFIDGVEHHNGISFSADKKILAAVKKNEQTDWDVVIFNKDSRQLSNEFKLDSREDSPEIAPNGGKLIFSSNRSGNWDVYSMNLDGTGIENLTKSQGNSRFASWFPDGQKIIFSSDRGGNGYRIFTMSSDGSHQKLLTIEGH